MSEAKAISIDEAIQLLTDDRAENLEGKFIQMCDLTILKGAKVRVEYKKEITSPTLPYRCILCAEWVKIIIFV